MLAIRDALAAPAFGEPGIGLRRQRGGRGKGSAEIFQFVTNLETFEKAVPAYEQMNMVRLKANRVESPISMLCRYRRWR